MKQFYFINGDKVPKESYYSRLKEEAYNIESLFEKIFNPCKKEDSELPMPVVYCDKEKIAIEMPNFYEFYLISFLKTLDGKKARIETIKGVNDYLIDDFEGEPIEFQKNNGILIFR
jgi:hypothetical protein